MNSPQYHRATSRPLEYDEAIITSMVRYGEADCIVRLFCAQKGSVGAFVKNGLRSSKTRGSIIQAPARAYVGTFSKPNVNLHRLVQVEIASATFLLSNNLRMWGFAAYIAELIELFLPIEEPAEAVFKWADNLFTIFAQGLGTASQLRAFELKLLNHCGYLPDLTSAVHKVASDESVRQAALCLLNCSLNESPEYDELLLRQVAAIFFNHLRSFHKGPLRSVDFLKSLELKRS